MPNDNQLSTKKNTDFDKAVAAEVSRKLKEVAMEKRIAELEGTIKEQCTTVECLRKELADVKRVLNYDFEHAKQERYRELLGEDDDEDDEDDDDDDDDDE